MRGIFWMMIGFGVFLGCSSAPLQGALDRLQPGMDKNTVLESAGNPKRTFRERGQDHWIYVYFEGDREFSREVVFESGKVERVGRPMAKANWEKEIEAGANRGSESGFKDVSGPNPQKP